MRKLFLLVAAVLIVNSVSAQDTLKTYWSNQQLKSIGLAIDSVEEGFWQYFHRDGSRMMEGTFKNGHKVGKWKAWYDNGKPSQEYFADKGPFKSWYSNGNLESEGQFEHGVKDGHWKFYYPDGKLYRDCTYLNDSLHGLVTEYFDGDQKQFEGNYVHGKLNGYAHWWRANGHLEMEGNSVDDLQEGTWKFYNPDGSLGSRGDFRNGLQHGQWEYFFENG